MSETIGSLAARASTTITQAQRAYDAQVPDDPDELPGGEAHKFSRHCGCPQCGAYMIDREAGEEKCEP